MGLLIIKVLIFKKLQFWNKIRWNFENFFWAENIKIRIHKIIHIRFEKGCFQAWRQHLL